jgi:hypothetical protein
VLFPVKANTTSVCLVRLLGLVVHGPRVISFSCWTKDANKRKLGARGTIYSEKIVTDISMKKEREIHG